MPEPRPESSETPFQPSFETEVFRQLERLTVTNESLADAVHDLHDTVDDHGKTLSQIKAYMAVRESGECPVKHEMDRRLVPLEARQLVLQGGWKAIAAVAGGISLIITVAYHFLGVIKLFSALKP